MTSIFDRALEPAFIEQLDAEAALGGWWADVLADPKLLIATRGKSLNVYWRGQSLFLVEAGKSGLKVTTHPKYLLDPALATKVSLIDGSFNVENMVRNGVIHHYKGPETLDKMKKAAGLFSGLEKTGCHEIAVRNPSVIDCEIAFPGSGSPSGDGDKTSANRVDIASLETDSNDARLVFWEAKHFSNPELRADGGLPPVCGQVEKYQNYLSANRKAIERSYAKVAANLKHLGMARPLSTLIEEVATGERTLTLGEKPKVGLIIFGFDMGQRDHPIWKDHLQRLKVNIPHVIAVGDAKKVTV